MKPERLQDDFFSATRGSLVLRGLRSTMDTEIPAIQTIPLEIFADP